jgi:hypothetical protein
MNVAVVEIPMRTWSTNDQKRMHTQKLARITSEERGIVGMLLRTKLERASCANVNRVELHRRGPKLLDDDNLRGSFKAVRDEIAAFLGTHDGPSSALKFEYSQDKGEYGIRITLGAT